MSKHHRRRLRVLLTAVLGGVLACNFPSLNASQPSTHEPVSTSAPSPTAGLIQSITSIPATPFQPATITPSATLPQATPTASYQPVFESAPCTFAVPAGYNPDCGYLVVPEDRKRAGSRLIRLHVAVFHSQAEQVAPDPVIHLAGGPGSSSLEAAGYLFQQGLDAILQDRDFILFDQRGVGYSSPRLDCPEREALTPYLLDGSLSQEQASRAIVDAFQACRDHLVADGIELEEYNSAASAEDIKDLADTLGYAQINLYAVSYGTRLALTVMRDHPEVVRSAVLDSTYPPQVNLYTVLAPNAERAFDVLFYDCAADPVCTDHYPNLRAVFYQLVDDLNANPVTVSITAGGATREVQLDGGLLIDVLFVGLYNPIVAARMPRMIYEIRAGNYSILQGRLSLYFEPSTALGMQMAVQCNEEIPFSDPQEAYRLAEGVKPQIAAFFPASVQPLFKVCEAWGLSPPEPIENLAVSSDLPTLIFAGEFDPITPPDWGRLAAGSLPQATFYEFPGNGHWVTRSSSCAREVMLGFLQAPAITPDVTCLQSLGMSN